jgi:rare lipoprotein A (peptidoglycan hydrolase)
MLSSILCILVVSTLPGPPPQPIIQPEFVPIVGAASSMDSNTGCYSVSITPNTPTGIAGCYREGEGIASHYGPGFGVAMNFCTWTFRHENGCGSVRITSLDNGRSVSVPVVDYCDCWTTTADERIIDLQWGVLDALGLDRRQGLYRVRVDRE